jgi:hypothetical protein
VKILFALLVAAGVITLAPSSASADDGRTRVLIIGDSVTQGRVGDFTWRYRLWNTLQGQGKNVDFVGPHTGLHDDNGTPYDNSDDSYDAPGYADPAFDQDHAAWWGMSLTDIDVRMNLLDTLAAEQPDVVINDLGINDLSFVATPTMLIDRMRQFVADVRSVNPHASVILGQLTQTWHLDSHSGEPVVEQYNAMLTDLGASLDQPGARVLVAPRPADYVEGIDTYDAAHPTASGEVKLADQFSSAFDTLPAPYRPTPPPTAPTTYAGVAHLAAAARPRAARLSFTTPTAATRQAVWKRDVTAHGRWHLVAYVPASTHTYRAGSLHRHHRYAFQLRAYSGPLMSTTYSNRVALRAR